MMEETELDFLRGPKVPDELLSAIYAGDGLFARVIDQPAEDAIRSGFHLNGIANRSIKRFFRSEYDYLDGDTVFSTAIKWARLYGGSIAVMLINDGRGIDEPLDWTRIKSIDGIRLYDRSLIHIAPGFDAADGPEYFGVNNKYGSFTVHKSRCLVFHNDQAPEETADEAYQLWGIPEYLRIADALKNAEITHRSAVRMVDMGRQTVYKMSGLSEILSRDGGERELRQKIDMLNRYIGLFNTIAIDEKDDFTIKEMEFAGVSDVTKNIMQYLCAATSIPRKVLVGTTFTEKKGTENTSMEIYYNFVERIQKRMLRGNLRYLLSVIARAGLYRGEIPEIPPLDVQFNPLWSLTEQEKAATDLKRAESAMKRAQAAQIHFEMGTMSRSEIRRNLASSVKSELAQKNKKGEN